MNRLKLAALIMALFLIGWGLAGCDNAADSQQEGAEQKAEQTQTEETEATRSDAAEDIDLRDIYGGGSTYLFTYKDEDYTAIYHYDNWCIYDSYKINSRHAMKKICQALIDEHPVHGSDYESFRTVDDMVYEWKQHNIAYKLLPDDNPWKTTTGNVDFDPEDQGKSLEEIYESRTGEEFNYSDHADDIGEYLKKLFEKSE